MYHSERQTCPYSRRYTVRAFVPERVLSVGTYRVLTSCVHAANKLFVVVRGKNIHLVQIPEDIIIISGKKGNGILEIKEIGGYKVPLWRDGTDEEFIAIDNYTGPESTTRSGS